MMWVWGHGGLEPYYRRISVLLVQALRCGVWGLGFKGLTQGFKVSGGSSSSRCSWVDGFGLGIGDVGFGA